MMKKKPIKFFRFSTSGQILDESLPRISAEDVAFDMDEIIIDEEDYYTDGTSDSDASSKDSVEDFEP